MIMQRIWRKYQSSKSSMGNIFRGRLFKDYFPTLGVLLSYISLYICVSTSKPFFWSYLWFFPQLHFHSTPFMSQVRSRSGIISTNWQPCWRTWWVVCTPSWYDSIIIKKWLILAILSRKRDTIIAGAQVPVYSFGFELELHFKPSADNTLQLIFRSHILSDQPESPTLPYFALIHEDSWRMPEWS